MTTTNESEQTQFIIPTDNALSTKIHITSRTDRPSIVVSGYLKDLPYDYDEIPVKIIALISKFYSSGSRTNKSIESELNQVIPWSCINVKNSIPTTKGVQGWWSTKSLLSLPQFLLEISIYILIIVLFFYIKYFVSIEKSPSYVSIFVPVAIIVATGGLYILDIYLFIRDINRVITMPIKNIRERVLALNSIFDRTPEIKFYIEGYHTDGNGKNKTTTFKKEAYLKLNQCDTIIEPNIYNENEKYGSAFYVFEFGTVLLFDDESDRLKYLELIKSFIIKNIHDSTQRFETLIRNTRIGDVKWDSGNDNHSFLIVVNSTHQCIQFILKSILALSTILCISFICKLFFCCIMKRKKLTIIKCLSVDKLGRQDVLSWKVGY